MSSTLREKLRRPGSAEGRSGAEGKSARKAVAAPSAGAGGDAAHGRRVGGRSARVVASVIEATLEALCEQGYGGLSIDDVARRAGVNKTTVYRRWPTRFDLAQAALSSLDEPEPLPVASGDVARDLVVHLHRRFGRITPSRRALVRLFLSGEMEPELIAILARVRQRRIDDVRTILESGVASGQLPRSAPVDLLGEVLLGTLVYARLRTEAISRERIEKMVGLVLAGARHLPQDPSLGIRRGRRPSR